MILRMHPNLIFFLSFLAIKDQKVYKMKKRINKQDKCQSLFRELNYVLDHIIFEFKINYENLWLLIIYQLFIHIFDKNV